MNYDNLLKNFEKCGDLYKILKIDPTADKKIIKKAYKDLALIYHPDKNKSHDASEKFQKIKEAYEILSDEVLKDGYEKYLTMKKTQQYKFSENNPERNRFAQDLLKREEEYNKKKEEEAQEKIKKFFERKAELDKKSEFKKKKEEEREELEKLNARKVVDDSEFYKKLNSIKVKWSSKTQQTYTEALLKMIFNVYGGIKECILFQTKNCAIIEFILTSSAEKAVNERKKEGVDDGLKAKFLFKKKRREDLILQLKNAQNKKVDYSINTETLERIGSIINRNSKEFIISKVADLQKRAEREKLISEILEQTEK